MDNVKWYTLVFAPYLQLRPGLVIPYITEMGVAHHIAPYTIYGKVTKSPWIFAKVTGSRRFFR